MFVPQVAENYMCVIISKFFVCLSFYVQVFLGMLYENENDANGIIQILRKFHKFVPRDKKQNQNKEVTEDELEREDANNEPVFGEQGIVGDQLSVERGINGHMSLSNGFTKEERLEGLHFEVADWHAGNKFLQVCIS